MRSGVLTVEYISGCAIADPLCLVVFPKVSMYIGTCCCLWHICWIRVVFNAADLNLHRTLRQGSLECFQTHPHNVVVKSSPTETTLSSKKWTVGLPCSPPVSTAKSPQTRPLCPKIVPRSIAGLTGQPILCPRRVIFAAWRRQQSQPKNTQWFLNKHYRYVLQRKGRVNQSCKGARIYTYEHHSLNMKRGDGKK